MLTSTGNLASGEAIVIVYHEAGSALHSYADLIAIVTHVNGNDAIALRGTLRASICSA